MPGGSEELTNARKGDSYAKLKYDATAEQNGEIIRRVAELSDRHGVTMTEISLAWLLTKVTAPVAGATKLHHIEGASKAVNLSLTAEELDCLEAPYVPHALVGVMAQNTASAAKKTMSGPPAIRKSNKHSERSWNNLITGSEQS